jgi:hypothetical protein
MVYLVKINNMPYKKRFHTNFFEKNYGLIKSYFHRRFAGNVLNLPEAQKPSRPWTQATGPTAVLAASVNKNKYNFLVHLAAHF